MEEDYKLFQLIRRNPINNCVDLSKNMIGKRSGFIYFTENFRIDFENKMANQARLQEENERLQKENEELMELKISASAEYQIHNLQKENKRYKSENETLKCSIAVANKLEKRIKEKFISKEKIEEWRKSKDKSLMWSNADDLYYFNKWTKELLESEE